ncbi:unnamed protein product [Periconia digitata]|uniref:Uncharacterized protein n=1 Tax=Periconia digitata TaxID=1303443 RepID=A0A9W4UD77_9PLEO|nr:unnamed protein product [Periconia digitata]
MNPSLHSNHQISCYSNPGHRGSLQERKIGAPHSHSPWTFSSVLLHLLLAGWLAGRWTFTSAAHHPPTLLSLHLSNYYNLHSNRSSTATLPSHTLFSLLSKLNSPFLFFFFNVLTVPSNSPQPWFAFPLLMTVARR